MGEPQFLTAVCYRDLPLLFGKDRLTHMFAVTFVCEGWQICRQTATFMKVGNNEGPILSHLWTEVYEILGHIGDPLQFRMPFPDLYTFRSENIRC